MSMPGWYPDPAGQQGQFRYWNGASWSSQTTSTPQSAPPPGTPSGRQPGRRGPGLLAAIAALVVVALAVWWFVARGSTTTSAPEDTSTAKPTVSAWNESSTPTPSSSSDEPDPSGASMTSCPTTGGQSVPVRTSTIEGGGLAVNTIDGWQDGSGQFAMNWAHNTESQVSTVQENQGNAWFSVVSLSTINRADGFTSVSQAAQGVMSCFATSSYYEGFTDRHDLMSQKMTVDGHRAYRVRSEVHVNDDKFPGITGDVVDVIVVDSGQSDQFGLFVSSYTIGDTQRQPLVDACIASLRLG